jgi:hypothetical protein
MERMPKMIAGVRLPDSAIAKQAAELLREHGSGLLYNHSLRSFVFASLKAAQSEFSYDAELLFVSAVFHDLGLTRHFSSADKRFEVDGANAAREFLKSHGFPEHAVQLVWDAVALHTTPGIAEFKEPEVALLNYGVALDVVGRGYETVTPQQREEIVKIFPREGFKNKIIPSFFEGFKHKTQTTYGNMNADICAYMIPGFKRMDFCELILNSPWSE